MALGVSAGCVGPARTGARTSPPVFPVVRAAQPIVVDGRLDDADWATAPVVSLQLPADALDAAGKPRALVEAGRARLAWDDEYLYLGIEFDDSDVVAEGERDGQMHFQFGDLVEFFIQPAGYTWYWELYATPADRQTVFFYPSGGRTGLPSMLVTNVTLRVAAQTEGTLNNWEDRDTRWTAEMAVPVSALTARGESWGPGSSWRALIARYNFSRWMESMELSSAPGLSRTSFHLRDEYARLEFLPPAAK